jgi:hypothetical protein
MSLKEILAVTKDDTFLAVMGKIYLVMLRDNDEENLLTAKTIRVLHQGFFVHTTVLCKRYQRTFQIEMIIHEPRNR